MDVWGYLRAVRKYWWMVLAAVVTATCVAIIVTIQTPPQYQSAVTFFINTPSDNIAGSVQGDSFGQKRVNSYVQLIGTDSLTNLVAAELNNGMTAAEIGAEISAKGDLNTVLLTATVTDGSAAQSLQIATSVGTQFVKLVSQLETLESGTAPTVRLDIVDGPKLNPSPVQPQPVRNIGLGLVLGLLLGVGLAVMREALDKSIRSVEMLQNTVKVPAIGVIPFDTEAKNSPLILDSHARSLRAEAFRQLRTNLQFVDAAERVQVIVITSSLAGEGKSSTAVNLAVAYSESGNRVLLIEADLRRPRVADYLGLEGAIGLTNVLAGQVQVADVLQPWGRGGLTVLASGSIPPNPSELLGSQAMTDLMVVLRANFEIIIVDTPPLLPVADAAVMAGAADGAVIVVRHGVTTRHQVTAAVQSLRAVDSRLLGAVLNMAPTKGMDATQYGYDAYYQDDETGTRPRLQGTDEDLSRDVPLRQVRGRRAASE